MKAAVFAGNGAIEIRDVPVPSVESADGVVLKVAANAICGTDVHALDVPPTVNFRPGVIIGHEFSGIVVDAGPNSGVSVGDRVGVLPNVSCGKCGFCSRGLPNLCILMEGFGSERIDGGAAEYAWAPGRTVFKLPDTLSMELASIAEPLSCVLNGTMRAGWQAHSDVVVLGGGPIGLMFAIVARSAGVRSVTVVEPASGRAAAAEDFGFAVVDPGDRDQVARLCERGADHVVDTVGTQIAEAIAVSRPRAKILIFGLDDTRQPRFPQADAVRKEVSIEGIFLARNTFRLALEMLARSELGFERLITHRYDLGDFTQAVNQLRNGLAIKALVIPNVLETA